jgi:hypothetical protein
MWPNRRGNFWIREDRRGGEASSQVRPQSCEVEGHRHEPDCPAAARGRGERKEHPRGNEHRRARLATGMRRFAFGVSRTAGMLSAAIALRTVQVEQPSSRAASRTVTSFGLLKCC